MILFLAFALKCVAVFLLGSFCIYTAARLAGVAWYRSKQDYLNQQRTMRNGI